MKKITCLAIGVMFFLTQFQTGSVLAQENTSTKQKNGHIKPESTLSSEEIAQTKQNLAENSPSQNSSEEIKQPANADGNKTLQKFSVQSQLSPSSLAEPSLLDMYTYSPYVIAAAAAKNHRNILSRRSASDLFPLSYYYDNLGDLDYVTNSAGVMVGDIFYCDGSESYNCPNGWLDFIDLNPTGAAANLDFYYAQDTPTTSYYASFPNEPTLWFFNIDTAKGTSVSNLNDPLYEGDGYPTIEFNLSTISGYVSGNPINPDWLLNLDFPVQRMTSMGNLDNSKNATFTSSPSSSIHRFWSDAKQGHFFTASADEKDSIIANDKSWRYESVAYLAVDSQASQSTPIYRFWSNSKQHHFYTASAGEKDGIIANDKSWAYESVAYYAYANEMPNTSAVYRFWSQQKQGHFFTTSIGEKDHIIANDKSWAYEGIAWYVPTN